jgi:hypothetical protein
MMITNWAATETCASKTSPVSYQVFPQGPCANVVAGTSGRATCNGTVSAQLQLWVATSSTCGSDAVPLSPTTTRKYTLGACTAEVDPLAGGLGGLMQPRVAQCSGTVVLPSATPSITPSGSSTRTATPTPSLSVGASPSSTPTFVATPTPAMVGLFSPVEACSTKGIELKSGQAESFVCPTSVGYSSVGAKMNVLVWVKNAAQVKIQVIGAALDGTYKMGVNDPLPRDLIVGVNKFDAVAQGNWVSLNNISCIPKPATVTATSVNPSGACAVSVGVYADARVWVDVFQSGATSGNAAGPLAAAGPITLIAIGGAVALLVFVGALVVMHMSGACNVPCFALCCPSGSSKKRKGRLTSDGFETIVPNAAYPVNVYSQPAPGQGYGAYAGTGEFSQQSFRGPAPGRGGNRV